MIIRIISDFVISKKQFLLNSLDFSKQRKTTFSQYIYLCIINIILDIVFIYVFIYVYTCQILEEKLDLKS